MTEVPGEYGGILVARPMTRYAHWLHRASIRRRPNSATGTVRADLGTNQPRGIRTRGSDYRTTFWPIMGEEFPEALAPDRLGGAREGLRVTVHAIVDFDGSGTRDSGSTVDQAPCQRTGRRRLDGVSRIWRPERGCPTLSYPSRRMPGVPRRRFRRRHSAPRCRWRPLNQALSDLQSASRTARRP